MTAPTFETLSVMVAGPIHGHADGRPWRWEVRHQIVGSVPVAQGHAATEAEAWTAARNAAVTVLGRLEVPGGGAQLRAALGGEP